MMAFNPNEHLTNMKGKDYLEVKWRIAWFRDSNPTGQIITEPLSLEPVIIKATIIDKDGNVLATGMGTATDTGKAVWSGRAIEKAETAAIGRALGHAGFGTQFADDEDADAPADSPVDRAAAKPKSQARQQTPPTPQPAPPAPSNGKTDALTTLRHKVHEEIDANLTDVQIAALAGIKAFSNSDEWKSKFGGMAKAFDSIKAEYEFEKLAGAEKVAF